jgi:hypothetical protein
MNNDIVKRLDEGLHDLDYQTMLNPLLDDAAKEILKLRKALRVAAGIISTYPPHVDQHPEDVYNWIIKESDYDNGD